MNTVSIKNNNLISFDLKTCRMRFFKLPQGLFYLKIINRVNVPKMVELCKSSTSVPNMTL